MNLTLYREDLKPEHADINCSQTKFFYFKDKVQSAIRIAGQAMFMEYDGSNYNAIYPNVNVSQKEDSAK